MSGSFQRYTPDNPCPVCEHCSTDPAGHCHGIITPDREWARCTRVDGSDGAMLDEKCSPSAYVYRRQKDGSYRPWTKERPMEPIRSMNLRAEPHGAPQKAAGKAGSKAHPRPASQRTFTYSETEGVEAVRAVEGGKKECYPKVRDHAGAPWRDGTGIAPTQRIYRHDDLERNPDGRVHLVEGEGCADALHHEGAAAITWRGGCGQLRQAIPQIIEAGRGRDVALLSDADDPGRAAMVQIAMALRGVAKTVRILNLYDDESGRDVEDWLHEGGTVASLAALIDATPAYEVDYEVEKITGGGEREAWTPTANPWPEPLAVEAFHGLPGEIVRAIEPHTESDPAALLLQLLVGAGNLIGRTPTLMMDGAAHHPNLFAVLVGTTSKARKGTSWRQIRRVLALVDPAWAEERITGGLSSGEGLIEAVADPPPDDNPSEPVDKRLMIQVGEFASVLAVQGREGNTLSAVLRDAWDGDTLTVLNRKANKLRATAPHISMVAHITRDELLRMLQTTEAANGYANRFLWAAVRRPKLLPRGGNLTDATLLPLADRLRAAVLIARRAQHITLTERAWEMWDEIYAELSRERAGLLGAITARAEPLVLRLAMLYALMDTAGEIDVPHLMAGCAVWEYCERSAAWVFGDQLGDPDGDVLLSRLRQRPEGITRTEIHGILGRNRSATQINRALTSLEEKNLARRVDEVPDGDRRQRTERWHAVHPEGK